MTARIVHTDADIEDWIDGATFVQVRVDIHRNPALWADLAPLYDRITAAEARLEEAQAAADRRTHRTEDTLGGAAPAPAPAGEDTLGQARTVPAAVADAQAVLDALVAEAETLYARYDADKETWVIRGLDVDEARQIVSEHPRPPLNAPAREPDEDPETFRARNAAYVQEVADYKVAIDEAALALAVVEVIVAGTHKPAPTLAGLRRLRARPHGVRHWAALVGAMETLTTGEVDIPAPHRTSAGA